MKRASSLFPFLRRALFLRHIMSPTRMNSEEARFCRWLGFGIIKGVTDPAKNLSILAAYKELFGGLHEKLVRGYDGIGPIPFRYDAGARRISDFGGFIRWAYFSDPSGGPGVFGIDWLSGAWQRSGIACSLLVVLDVAKTAARHGIPLDAEVALLNARMCEEHAAREMRERAGLYVLSDWVEKGN